jgi:hypothetical protein
MPTHGRWFRAHPPPGDGWYRKTAPGMRIALVCTPHVDSTLRLAAQMGASDLVAWYPAHIGRTLDDMVAQAKEHGLRLSIVEGYIPHDARRAFGSRVGRPNHLRVAG